jgi:UDP-perosamine 4-acetyltransferase
MKSIPLSEQPLVMLGSGGHAKVLHALVLAQGRTIVGVCDPLLAQQGARLWRGVPVLGADDALAQFDPDTVGLINGLGQLVGMRHREQVYERQRQAGFCFPALVHPAAWVAPTASLAQGVQVMAGAVVQPDCRIGENSIVNTHASVDHDCDIGAHVHIAPGATLCGNVRVDARAFVASGSTVIQGVVVGCGAVVGAGATLLRDLAPGQILRGTKPRATACPTP